MQQTEFAFRESGPFLASYVGYAVYCANPGKHVEILLFSLAARGVAFRRILYHSRWGAALLCPALRPVV